MYIYIFTYIHTLKHTFTQISLAIIFSYFNFSSYTYDTFTYQQCFHFYLRNRSFSHKELCVSSIAYHFSPPKRNSQLESICNVKSRLASLPPRQAASGKDDLLLSVCTKVCPSGVQKQGDREASVVNACFCLTVPHREFEFYISGCACGHQGVFVSRYL